jgi:hypothetical protein
MPNSMQNKTKTTTNTRCSHTGISAGFSVAGSGDGGGFSRFVGVSKGILFIFGLET